MAKANILRRERLEFLQTGIAKKKNWGERGSARTLDLTHNFSYETYALANFPSMLMYWFGVNLNWNIKEFH
jgi:hypothetical protein